MGHHRNARVALQIKRKPAYCSFTVFPQPQIANNRQERRPAAAAQTLLRFVGDREMDSSSLENSDFFIDSTWVRYKSRYTSLRASFGIATLWLIRIDFSFSLVYEAMLAARNSVRL